MGLRGLDPTDVNSHSVRQHRVCCGIVSPPGQPTMAVYSAYFFVGQGVGDANIDLLRDILQHRLRHDLPVLVGGDFQIGPEQWQATSWPSLGALDVICGSHSEPSYVHSTTASVLDYFLVSSSLAAGIQRVGAVMRAPARCHRPVEIVFYDHLGHLQALKFRAPSELPRELPFGPLLPDAVFDDSGGPLEQILCATNLLARGEWKEALHLRDLSYMEWAARSEEELASKTGATMTGRGVRNVRGRHPTLSWQPVVRTQPPAVANNFSAISAADRPCHALSNLARQAANLAEKFSSDPLSGRRSFSTWWASRR